MRRDQPTTPFDVEADDMTQQFWGASKSWVSGDQPATVRRRAARPDAANRGRADDTTGSLRVIREGFAAFRPQTSTNVTGEVQRQRQHGVPHTAAHDANRSSRRDATLGELAAGRANVGGWLEDELSDEHLPSDDPRGRLRRAQPDAEHDVPLTPVLLADRLGLGAVDPLLLRAGVFVLTMILLVPVMLSLRPDRDDSLPGEVVEVPTQVVAGAAPAVGVAPAPASDSALVAQPVAASSEAVASSPTEPAAPVDAALADDGAASAPASTSDSGSTAAPASESGAAAAVDVVAERIVPACPQTYPAAPGDSWYRIADEAGIAPSELLAENNATAETVILPGDDICLPEGAAMPTPPTTTVAPTATEPTAATPTTATPTTTPATTVAPVANLSRSEVQELIRQTWPEDEVDKALAVAQRESNFVATADNGWCCVGVFQLYWTVHRGWLDDYGVTERSDLFDARKNVAAAFQMWQTQGWGPWGG